jgi:hypothetical protein
VQGLERDVVARVQLGAIRGIRVELLSPVRSSQKPVAISASGVAADNHDAVANWSPFALHTDKSRAEIEDQVISFPLD